MDVEVLSEVMAEVGPVECTTADRGTLRAALDGVRRVRAWADHAEVLLAERLAVVSPLAASELAEAAHRPPRHGGAVLARAATVAAVPALRGALRSGTLDGSHVQAFASALRGLTAKDRAVLAERAQALVAEAVSKSWSPDAWSARLAEEVQRLDGDGGEQREARQRRATLLRTWTERATGMWRLSGSFDAASGALLHGRIEAVMAALFAERAPSTSPQDPGERQDHLRALALLALTSGHAGARSRRDPMEAPPPADGVRVDRRDHAEAGATAQGAEARVESGQDTAGRDGQGGRPDGEDCLGQTVDGRDRYDEPVVVDQPGPRSGRSFEDEWSSFLNGPRQFGRPEMIVVVHLSDLGPDGWPLVDWGLPLRPSWTSVAQLAQRARIWPVVVDRGTVVAADGVLNLGRTARLANRAQRRALQGLYATCAIPGCSVRFAHTRPHHIWSWEDGGPTDLHNLIPLCSRHHHDAHDSGWKLTLGANRELTIEFPDGTTMSTGPPSRSAA